MMAGSLTGCLALLAFALCLSARSGVNGVRSDSSRAAAPPARTLTADQSPRFVVHASAGATGAIRSGRWRIPPGGSLASAISAFGRPVRCALNGHPSDVTADWSSPRLSAGFYTLGGGRPLGCARRSILVLSAATCTDPACVSVRGVRVGSSLAELRRKYPGAPTRRRADGGRDHWLVTTWCFVPDRHRCTLLSVAVADGLVVSFDLRLGLGGD
jgi:hypothetical protein